MNHNKNHKILIVDDEAAILRLLVQLLVKEGHRIDTANSGTEAIIKIIENEYDLIITDIKMSDISGKEVLAHIRKIKGDTIPVIGISGTPWLLDRCGFNAILSKPCSNEKLTRLISRLLYKFNSI